MDFTDRIGIATGIASRENWNLIVCLPIVSIGGDNSYQTKEPARASKVIAVIYG